MKREEEEKKFSTQQGCDEDFLLCTRDARLNGDCVKFFLLFFQTPPLLLFTPTWLIRKDMKDQTRFFVSWPREEGKRKKILDSSLL
jgi:hypothetical protein